MDVDESLLESNGFLSENDHSTERITVSFFCACSRDPEALSLVLLNMMFLLGLT